MRAQSSPEARRLLRVYAGRLHSNLAHALSQITESVHAHAIAEGAGALIDGLYIRRALKSGSPDPESAIQVVETFVDAMLAQAEPTRERSNDRG